MGARGVSRRWGRHSSPETPRFRAFPVSPDIQVLRLGTNASECFRPKPTFGGFPNGGGDKSKALAALNIVLAREGWEAVHDKHGIGQRRHKGKINNDLDFGSE